VSFQAYLDTIERKTGLVADDLRRAADAKGYSAFGALKPETTATMIIDWLKAEHGLGRGHAMAVFALLKGLRQEGDA